MPRPKNKADLLLQSQQNFDKLMSFLADFSHTELNSEFPEGTMNRNVRDVLGHLYYWHLMMLRWYEEGMQGIKPAIPAEGYTWKTTPALNRHIWEACQSTDLDMTLRLFRGSHERVHALIGQHTDEELFEKKRYKWTGSTSLGAYLVSATSSHYDWAFKLIKKAYKGMMQAT
ncbi:MAG: ClbS/DfsB family four-helix bundle protein [Bacteroidota bacterium]